MPANAAPCTTRTSVKGAKSRKSQPITMAEIAMPKRNMT